MEEEVVSAEQYELPARVGEKLRAAREAKGWSLAQVAAETRITQRHLALIEAGDFGALPGRTYSVGFSKTYAKLVGLDENEIADDVRAELAMIAPRDTRALTFEPGDPARVPSVRLAWISALAALILFIGGAVFVWTNFVAGDGVIPGDEKDAPAKQAARPSAPNPTGAVVFTALEKGVWVKFYDADGRQLMQGEMLQGESYTVPANVQGPLLATARPTALAITVGGTPIAPLADTDRTLKDVPVTPAALLARQAAGATPSAAPTTSTRASRPRASSPAAEPTPQAQAAEPAVPAASPTA